MTTTDRAASHASTPTGSGAPRGIELNGLNTIDESERRGRARDLFWPWFGANVSVFGISYGSFLLLFKVSFAQALVIGVLGIVVSFLLCGFVALAGKRGSAPTMVLSRAAFGVRGNRLPSLLSWLLTVGWETVLTALAVLSTATVFERLGAGGGVGTKVVALVVVAALIVAAGVVGFTAIMRLQRVITVVTGVLTVVYVLLVLGDIDLAAVGALPGGGAPAVVGGLVFMMTGFGLGWVNAAADYSRYLPRRTSSAGVVGWTTFGSALAPVLLLVGGLVGSYITRRNAVDQAERAKREEVGRTIRWAAEQAVSHDERVRQLGVDALQAYADSDLLDDDDRRFLESVTDSVLAPTLGEIEEVADVDLDGVVVTLDTEEEGGADHG